MSELQRKGLALMLTTIFSVVAVILHRISGSESDLIIAISLVLILLGGWVFTRNH